MTPFTVVFKYADGSEVAVKVPVMSNGDVLASMSLLDPSGAPIIVQPFYMHGRGLHTMCSRLGRDPDDDDDPDAYNVHPIEF